MSPDACVADGLEARLALLADVATGWPSSDLLEVAVRDTCRRWSDDDEDDAWQQLVRVVRPFADPQAVRAVLAREAGRPLEEVAAPGRTAILAAGTVPGLAIERLLWSLALGSSVVVRPSKDDRNLAPFVQELGWTELAGNVEVVGELAWDSVDSAVVMGSDETVAWVRGHLPPGAPLQAFGSKRGVVIATARGLAAAGPVDGSDGDWAEALRDDRRRFGGRGCMSPHDEVLVGVDEDLWSRRVDDAWTARSRSDRRALASIGIAAATAGLPPTSHVADAGELRSLLDARRSSLQTVVLACREDEHHELATIALEAGATRVCAPGEAHEPPFGWVHDGRGQVADLLR